MMIQMTIHTKNKNILVEEEDEEPQDTKKVDALDNPQIGNTKTNDIENSHIPIG